MITSFIITLVIIPSFIPIMNASFEERILSCLIQCVMHTVRKKDDVDDIIGKGNDGRFDYTVDKI